MKYRLLALLSLGGLLMGNGNSGWTQNNEFAPLMCPIVKINVPIELSDLENPLWTFSATIHGTTEDVVNTLTYEWVISEGQILSGQGTPVITTSRPPSGRSITATVEIRSPHLSSSVCPVVYSDTATNFMPTDINLHNTP